MAAPAEQQQLSITAVIAGRKYPLRVAASDEEGMRAVIQEINQRLNEYQVRFQDRDTQDCLVMTLLTYADELRSARNLADTSMRGELATRLRGLNTLVDGMLAE